MTGTEWPWQVSKRGESEPCGISGNRHPGRENSKCKPAARAYLACSSNNEDARMAGDVATGSWRE